MDKLSLWLGVVICVASVVGWLTSIYVHRHRKVKPTPASDKSAKTAHHGDEKLSA